MPLRAETSVRLCKLTVFEQYTDVFHLHTFEPGIIDYT
jgi:hypothetical protein